MGKRLAPEHFRLLKKRLTGMYTLRPKFAALLPLGKNLDAIANFGNLIADIDAVVRSADAEGWVDQLIQAALDDQDQEDQDIKKELQKIFDTLIDDSYIEKLPDPFEACWLSQDRPFINRGIFRQTVKKMSRPDGKRFLVVNGPLGSGKTHSHHLIQALKSHINYRYCYISLEKEIPSKYQPDVMAHRIDTFLNLPKTRELPSQQSVGDRWAQEICDWLVEKLLNCGELCWVVLDGFGNPDLADETKRFLENLVDAVNNLLSNVRLVLLDYPAALPRDLRPFVNVEDIQEIGPGELFNFIELVFKNAQLTYDANQVNSVIAKIMEGLPAGQGERLFEIMSRVMQMKYQLGI